MGISYRARQFFQALNAGPSPVELDQARAILSPELMHLFLRMGASDQAHSIQVMQKLREDSNSHPELLSAALLHDVGKCLYPLHVWERVMIVLAKAFFPEQARRWGSGEAHGWKRAFVVAEQHPAWGAELAEQAGASPITIQLIRRHQEPRPTFPRGLGDHSLGSIQEIKSESGYSSTRSTRRQPQNFSDRLLTQLQLADDES